MAGQMAGGAACVFASVPFLVVSPYLRNMTQSPEPPSCELGSSAIAEPLFWCAGCLRALLCLAVGVRVAQFFPAKREKVIACIAHVV